MKKTILRFVVATSTFAFLPIAAHAQVGQVQPPTTQQPNQPQQQPNQVQRPGTIRNADGAQGQGQNRAQGQNQASSQQSEQRLEQLVASKLLTANKSVVELSKMAVENAEHDNVKEFAQTLVSEHEKLCRDIEKLQAASGHKKDSDHSKTNEQSTDQSAANVNRPNQNRQNLQGQAANRQANKTQDGNWSSNSQGMVGKLQMINEKASKKQLEMAKQMLQDKKGDEFDMAFVGMQIASHTRAVAELSALEGVGSKEMQDVVKKAEEATSKHLEQAKGLAEELSSK